MLTISKDANRNYLAKVVKLKGLKKHSNADRLQCVIIDFQNVITDMTAKDGDVYIFFPVECEINKDFLSYVNAFREKELNQDQTQTGFFEKNCRVRAVKLRGEKSEGFIIPVHKLEEFARTAITEVDNSSIIY
jgi:tRNA-binding EMAP/Myf-like protein